MKQTAVEWLVEDLIHKGIDLKHYQIIIGMAKEMEKEQIVKAAYEFMGTNFDSNMGRAEQYYNGTYKQQEL
jgi:hypothetical protein